MSDNHPLGLRTNRSRTRIRKISPRPAPLEEAQTGPRSHAHPSPHAAPPGQAGRRPSHNPLLEAFGDVLEACPELSRAEAPADPETLRQRLHERITAARDRAHTFGVDAHRAGQAAWYVAALADDLALNTPWGQASSWPQNTLIYMLDGTGGSDTGTKFFQNVDDLKRFPERDREMLELAAFCLTLGFQGMHRDPDGRPAPQLLHLTSELSRLLGAGGAAPALSTRWKGAQVPDIPRRAAIPLWVMGLGAAGLLLVLHTGLGAALSRQATALQDDLAQMPPLKRAELVRTLTPARIQVPPAQDTEAQRIDLLSEFVERTKAEALIDPGHSIDDSLVTRLVLQSDAPELFRSGRASLHPDHKSAVDALAALILEYEILIVQVTVEGYTDNRPVSASNPFTDNDRLSAARAETVREALIGAGLPPNFIVAKGLGASDPIASNDTAAGRASNRRVELVLQKTLSKTGEYVQ